MCLGEQRRVESNGTAYSCLVTRDDIGAEEGDGVFGQGIEVEFALEGVKGNGTPDKGRVIADHDCCAGHDGG